jgi:hypothetical protein
MDTLGMPDCQSGAAFSKAAAPVPVSMRMATNRICQADCHEESCGNALYYVACSSGTSARLFPGERDGRSLAQRSVPKGEVAAAQRGRCIVCRSGQIQSSRHPSLLGSDRASRRMLIALRKNHHHASDVALKVLATWAGAVNDSGPCANCYTHSKSWSSVTAKTGKQWRLSPFLSPCSRPRSAWIVAGVAGVANSVTIDPRQSLQRHSVDAQRSIYTGGKITDGQRRGARR